VPEKQERAEGRQLLTPKQAKLVLLDLAHRRDAIYWRRDLDLVPATFTASSPIRGTVVKEIRNLRRQSVIARIRETTKKLSVISLKPQSMRLRQVAVIHAKFLQYGENITSGGAHTREIIKWVIHRDNGHWLIHKGSVLKRVNLKGKGNR